MQIREGGSQNVFDVPTTTSQTVGSLHPGVGIPLGSYEIIHDTMLSQPGSNVKRIADQREYIYVWGNATYKDGFDKLRWTRFCFRYDTDNKTNAGIAAKKARYHSSGNDAT
jgi:hypothetical protein